MWFLLLFILKETKNERRRKKWDFASIHLPINTNKGRTLRRSIYYLTIQYRLSSWSIRIELVYCRFLFSTLSHEISFRLHILCVCVRAFSCMCVRACLCWIWISWSISTRWKYKRTLLCLCIAFPRNQLPKTHGTQKRKSAQTVENCWHFIDLSSLIVIISASAAVGPQHSIHKIAVYSTFVNHFSRVRYGSNCILFFHLSNARRPSNEILWKLCWRTHREMWLTHLLTLSTRLVFHA